MLRACLVCLLPLTMLSGVTNISKFNRQDFPIAKPQGSYLLIISNDGGIYKFEPSSREILWHNTLKTDLMSVNMSSLPESSGYFLPDLNGDFIYVSTSRNVIQVQRSKLQKLLNLCFESDQKHFMYDAINYYVIDMISGHLDPLEQFLKTRQPINKTTNAIVRVDRKYLKSLKHDTEENWNIISSDVEFLTVEEFLSPHRVVHRSVMHPLYRFSRKGASKIEVADRRDKGVYELESDASFIRIFSYDGKGFSKHRLESTHLHQRTIDQSAIKSNSQQLAPLFESLKHQAIIPQSCQQPKTQQNCNKCNESKQPAIVNPTNLEPTEFCVNSFRFIQDDFHETFLKQLASQQKQRQSPSNNPNNNNPNPNHKSKQQLASVPAVSLLIIIIVCVVACYIGLTALSKNILSMKDNVHLVNKELERRIQEMERKLEGVEEMRKEAREIYTVDYGRILEQDERYTMYQAMLLGKRSRVYVLNKPLELEFMNLIEKLYDHQPNNIIKILYFEENAENLLVFVEVNLVTLAEKIKTEMSTKAKYQLKHQIALFVDNLVTHKIEIDSLSPENIVFDKDGNMKYNLFAHTAKIWQSPEHIKGEPIIHNSNIFMVGSLIYYIHSGGDLMFKHTDDELQSVTVDNLLNLKKSPKAIELFDKDIALQNLLDLVLVPDRLSAQTVSFKDIAGHFYFWDIGKKLAFVNEFSNYMETFLDEEKVKKIQEFSSSNAIITYPWSRQLHKVLLQEINNFKKYSYYSVKDLIRAIRNKTSHFLEISQPARQIVGHTKQDLCQYFLNRFPKLICFMYVYSKKKKWKI